MLITTYGPERWDLMNRGTDSEGRQMCHVRRVALDATKRVTIWRLVKYPNGWRNVGQIIASLPGPQGFRPTPERHGVKLSNSRTDLRLLGFAEQGYGAAYDR